jgi:NADP-dependent 3-hydroxy acid dehydrogenase YdfG
MSRPVAVVTGASVGIGAATARRLAAEGFEVVCAARGLDRLEALAKEIDGRAIALDVRDDDSVAALAAAVPDCKVLVNNAGGALGLDPVSGANLDDWQWMYDVNVLGLARVTKALLPALIASGDGHIVIMSSTAGHIVYEGGAGYAAAKHGSTVVAETLRLELWDKPVRITEIAPGMVKTETFSLNRFRGDAERAESVYAGVRGVLVAEDIADCVAWTVTRPWHVNIDLVVVRPRAQAAQHTVFREG